MYDGWTESEKDAVARKARFENQLLEVRMKRNWYNPNSAQYDHLDQVMEDMITEENEAEQQAAEVQADAEWLGTAEDMAQWEEEWQDTYRSILL